MRTQYDIKHEGTLGSEDRTAMTFDENSIAHLMTVLTDLYSNPTLAVVREYSTNARDAHIAAGNPDPIQVRLPNVMNNMLIIQDFGTGMSKDDITDHFSKYGWSSKRDNDEETGMLGLGCKSGLTYTSQFTLVTTQDGIQNTVLVTREESGGGVVQIIDTQSTDELNGTEVQIPVKGTDNMCQTARAYFQYWERGTVLIDDEEPESIWESEKAIQVDPDIILLPLSQNGQRQPSMVVMGNVAYPVDVYKLPHHLQGNNERMRAIVRVPVGCVNFTPSREQLQYTKRTLETIEDAWDYINRGLSEMVQKQIDAAPDAKAAFVLWQEWRNVTFTRRQKRKLEYKGTPLVEYLTVPDNNLNRTLILPLKKNSWSETDRSERVNENIKLDRAFNCVLHVVGHQGTAVAASTKARIREYARSKGLTDGEVLIYPHIFGAPWFTNATCNRVRFDVIQRIVLPDQEEKERKKRTHSKYRMLVDQYNLQHYDVLPDNCECWVPAAWTEISRKEVAEFSGRGKVAVVLAADQKRFLRDHPTIPLWIDWAKERVLTTPTSANEWESFHWYERQTKSKYPYSPSDTVPAIFGHLSDKIVWSIMDPDLRNMMMDWGLNHGETNFENRMWTVHHMSRNFPDLVIPDVPEFPRITAEFKRLKKFYEGLLDIAPHHDHGPAFVQALNSFYIVKHSLHTIPVL